MLTACAPQHAAAAGASLSDDTASAPAESRDGRRRSTVVHNCAYVGGGAAFQ